jgi:hypothetical protein
MGYWGDRVDREIGLTGIYVIEQQYLSHGKCDGPQSPKSVAPSFS